MPAEGGSAFGGKKYELIVFDFDGTLVDTLEDIAYHANSVLTDHGFPARAISDVRKAIGWGVHELLKELAPGFGLDAGRLEAAVDLFKKKYREDPVRKTDAFDGVRKVLEGPLSKIKKAIVTNKPQDITEQILKKLGLDGHFEMTIGMHAGFLPKPDPSSVLHVMSSLGVLPKKTVFVGDSGVDADAAQNAGIDFAWVSYGYDQPQKMNFVARFSSANQWSRLCL